MRIIWRMYLAAIIMIFFIQEGYYCRMAFSEEIINIALLISGENLPENKLNLFVESTNQQLVNYPKFHLLSADQINSQLDSVVYSCFWNINNQVDIIAHLRKTNIDYLIVVQAQELRGTYSMTTDINDMKNAAIIYRFSTEGYVSYDAAILSYNSNISLFFKSGGKMAINIPGEGKSIGKKSGGSKTMWIILGLVAAIGGGAAAAAGGGGSSSGNGGPGNGGNGGTVLLPGSPPGTP